MVLPRLLVVFEGVEGVLLFLSEGVCLLTSIEEGMGEELPSHHPLNWVVEGVVEQKNLVLQSPACL